MILNFIDFNTYYGEPSSNSLMSKVLPVILGTFLGFGLSKLSEFITYKTSIKKAGTDLLNEISLLKLPIQRQTKELDELSILLKKENTEAIKLEINFSLNTKRIELIDRNKAVDYFVTKYKGDRKQAREKLNNIYVGLDIIAFENKRIEKLFEEYIQQGISLLELWKQNLDIIIQYCSDFIIDIEKREASIEEDTFISAFYSLYKNNFKEGSAQDIFIMRDSFHIPLAELTAKYRTDSRVIELRSPCYQCFQAIGGISALKEDCSIKCSRLSKSLTFQYSKIEKEISQS